MRALASGLAASLLATAPASADDPEALRAALERDRALLIELLRAPRADDARPLAEDPALRAIAERMPRMQAALREAREDPGAPR
jgi:hypothetical protein